MYKVSNNLEAILKVKRNYFEQSLDDSNNLKQVEMRAEKAKQETRLYLSRYSMDPTSYCIPTESMKTDPNFIELIDMSNNRSEDNKVLESIETVENKENLEPLSNPLTAHLAGYSPEIIDTIMRVQTAMLNGGPIPDITPDMMTTINAILSNINPTQ